MLARPACLAMAVLLVALACGDPVTAQSRRRRPVRPGAASAAPAAAVKLDTPGKKVRRIRTVIESGGRVDWSRASNQIAFDRLGDDGYYDLFVSDPEGRNQVCITCGKSRVPDGHKGNPAWHPSGRYIVFQASRRQDGRGRRAFLDAWLTNPGAGFRNDLWLTGPKGDNYVRLTDVGSGGAVLHAHFSHDGGKLLWSQRVGQGGGPTGVWAVMVGDVSIDGDQPRLTNIRKFQPGSKPRFYETHGFFDDGSIALSTNSDGQAERGYDIYRFDYRSGKLTKLTDTPDVWDEHAQLSPDGKKIVWMSGEGLGAGKSARDVRTDFWIMNSDGSNKERLTYFNDPGAPEHIPTGWIVAADSAWGPDSRRLLAYVKTDIRSNSGPLLLLELD